jgi:CheY-like chemotaxis protein
LVADDNADMREYLKRLLTPDYDVQTAEDGAAALSKLRRERPDLLLCDVMMPQLDGFGLLRAIRTDPELQDLPVILLSARAGEARVKKAAWTVSGAGRTIISSSRFRPANSSPAYQPTSSLPASGARQLRLSAQASDSCAT